MRAICSVGWNLIELTVEERSIQMTQSTNRLFKYLTMTEMSVRVNIFQQEAFTLESLTGQR